MPISQGIFRIFNGLNCSLKVSSGCSCRDGPPGPSAEKSDLDGRIFRITPVQFRILALLWYPTSAFGSEAPWHLSTTATGSPRLLCRRQRSDRSPSRSKILCGPSRRPVPTIACEIRTSNYNLSLYRAAFFKLNLPYPHRSVKFRSSVWKKQQNCEKFLKTLCKSGRM